MRVSPQLKASQHPPSKPCTTAPLNAFTKALCSFLSEDSSSTQRERHRLCSGTATPDLPASAVTVIASHLTHPQPSPWTAPVNSSIFWIIWLSLSGVNWSLQTETLYHLVHDPAPGVHLLSPSESPAPGVASQRACRPGRKGLQRHTQTAVLDLHDLDGGPSTRDTD